MSARGARSRKAVAKDIEKKEKKAASNKKPVESIRRPHDAFTDWRPTLNRSGRDTSTGIPSRSITISSDASRATSRSSSTHASSGRPRLNTIDSQDSLDFKAFHRPMTSQSGSASISESSTQGKEKTKYDANRKGSKAPRGRGGGVPVKKTVVSSPPPPLFRNESSASHVPTNHKTWQNFRIWEGGESGLRPYGGFEYDEHMQSGNVLIYFTEEQVSEDRPVPQIRADLETLEKSGSTWLSNALLYGRIDDNEDEWTLPGSPESSVGPSQFPGAGQGQRRMLGPTSPGGRSPPPFNIDQAYYRGTMSETSSRNPSYYPPGSGLAGHLSPPPSNRPNETTPTHELWFTAPAHLRTPQAQRLHHVAVRNFIAMLHNKPIVGADLFEMLSTLQPEIQVMYDLDHTEQSRTTPRERSVQMITQYLTSHGLDDMRNSIKLALGLLAWSEQESVKWRQGYLESFVHLAGIMSPQIEDLPDFKRLSIVTRRNLGIAAKTLQLQILETEEKLATFDFADLWEDTPKAIGGAVYQNYNGFRAFLVDYYTKIYGNWPPNQGKSWLNRKMVLGLQEDFGSLYDYLVNRDVIWDSREERPGKKWKLVNRCTEDFSPDFPDLALTDMLVSFDNRHGYLHIPHPYPLLPREVPQIKSPQKRSFFSGLKKSKVDTKKDEKAHLQLSIVFSDATNIEKLDVSFNGSTLIDQFERFELSADLKSVTPREARLGRWVLLYGILQVLSELSVDIQGLKWTEGVRYFLCTDLKRCPDWVTNGQAEYMEASQQRSWCWQRSWDPTPIAGAPVELEGSCVPVGAEIDGGGSGTMRSEDAQSLDGTTMLNNDIRRISEKIDDMGRMRQYERRIENEKIKQEEFGKTKRDQSYRLTESDFVDRPLVPSRSPLRSPASPASPHVYGNYQPMSPHAMSPQAMSPHALSPQGYVPQTLSNRVYYQEDKPGWA
ncbi:uncharacterized protein BDR25DRAFT_339446 [Lindgomyces ingoldianus]|uniref:Uncharacterized protein n=1 Tax=Lindgomyces ingoldianus TaxID=673940 RepID=A0ACB6RB19_9PLEO|nr:uncharacterized protein BDR25DRAFT_339446 [Lindgomyces ingoldianus]KAF2476439.1 hypothetical protein BDR25DRAFT_339446 [Lindgomyces ingoldianus]